jgi:putative salt-induced outer membrane protein
MKTLAGFAALLIAMPAAAQLPPAVKAMVEAAARSGDKAKTDAVVAVAKDTNKGSEAEIDAIVAAISAEQAAAREAKLAEAGFLDNWSGQGELGASLATGNSDTKTFAAGLALQKDGLRIRHKLNAAADIQKSNGVTSQERILAGYQLDWKLSDRAYAYGRFDYERNRQAGIKRRFMQSAGIGYALVNSPGFKWSVEGGPALRQTRFEDFSESSFAVRGGSNILWKLSESMDFTNDTALFIEGNGSLTNTTALTARIFGALSARVAFNLTWEEEPPVGLEKLDTLTRFTLVYAF